MKLRKKSTEVTSEVNPVLKGKPDWEMTAGQWSGTGLDWEKKKCSLYRTVSLN